VLFHLQFAFDGNHLMPGRFAVAPEAQVEARLPYA
jgi:hypothetical protein